MLPDFAPVEEALRAWAAAAGVRVDQVVLNRRGRPVLILPLTDASYADSRQSIPLEILKVLRSKSPLTGLLVLDELDRRGVKASKRTIDGHLADMVQDGTLLNPPGVKPQGYRLPPGEATE